MAIKDLKARQGNVEVTAEVIEKGEERTFSKFGKEGRVCNATIKDESGKVKLTLWNEQVDQLDVGDKIKITNGYVNEWQGELQLTTGKFGKLEVVEKGEGGKTGKPEQSEESTDDIEEDGFEDIEEKPEVEEEEIEEEEIE